MFITKKRAPSRVQILQAKLKASSRSARSMWGPALKCPQVRTRLPPKKGFGLALDPDARGSGAHR